MRRTIPAALALSLVPAIHFGCAPQATVVTWQESAAPRHAHATQDWWQYQFVYHPQAQVYLEPYTRTWFWFKDGQWHEGPVLDPGIHLDHSLSRIVLLNSRTPHEQHDTVAVAHGPWRSRHPSSRELDADRMHALTHMLQD
jgi:hypothetical protein